MLAWAMTKQTAAFSWLAVSSREQARSEEEVGTLLAGTVKKPRGFGEQHSGRCGQSACAPACTVCGGTSPR